jgi:uncharacterized protein
MPYEPPPELSEMSLSAIAQYAADRKLPPINQWQPEKTGDSEIRIANDGRWFHQGGEITRPAMIRAFSSLLRRDDDGSHWLVTPYEKLSIIVEDAPFIAVELRSEGGGDQRALAFRLNTDDLVVASAEHPLEFRPLPYLHVRDDLWAKLARPVYYELAEMAIAEDNSPVGLWSKGQFFAIEGAE